MGLEETELNDDDDSGGGKSVSSSSVSCSICLEVVFFGDGRSCVKLICGHEFHLGTFLFRFDQLFVKIILDFRGFFL